MKQVTVGGHSYQFPRAIAIAAQEEAKSLFRGFKLSELFQVKNDVARLSCEAVEDFDPFFSIER